MPHLKAQARKVILARVRHVGTKFQTRKLITMLIAKSNYFFWEAMLLKNVLILLEILEDCSSVPSCKPYIDTQLLLEALAV